MSKQPSRVVQENIDALIERERAGRIEHGDDMDRTDFPVEAWLAELISESLDSANYGRKLQHMLPKLVAAAKRLEGMGFAWADGSWQATCTCPSGDGSLRWPCPVHTAGVHGAVAKVGSDHFRSIVDWLGPIPPPNTLLYAAPVTASPADHLHAHLLHMLGAKDHEDAGRIIGQLHAATMRTPGAPGIDIEHFHRAVQRICIKFDGDLPYISGIAEVLDLIDASPKGDDVPHRDLVPGVMRCAKCAFQLHRTNLYLGSGTTGPGDSKTEPCPNGCGPLWPVTWQTWATEGWQQAERYFEELRQLQDSPKGGSEACERIAAMLYQEATDEPWTVAGVEHDGPDRAYYRELARRVLDAALVSGEAHHG